MRELTRAAARKLDETAQHRFMIPGIVLMENAARAIAELARAMIGAVIEGGAGGQIYGARVVIVCGVGNNGGDGYAIARHLANSGARVELAPIGPPIAGSDAALNEAICRRMGIPFVFALETLRSRPDLVVDAIFGTGLDRPVEGVALEVIQAINRCGAPVLSVDLPSGIDNDTGTPLGDAVRATVTAVTVAPRPAMRAADARQWFGKTRVVDIGAPASLLREFGVEVQTGVSL
ncbi:MAG: NAD(P)H-hydrate epimerase [Phycisphaerae bacterium]|nr:NAD(P)H-hydrate epimerase [Phycisphaerae bacterium]